MAEESTGGIENVNIYIGDAGHVCISDGHGIVKMAPDQVPWVMEGLAKALTERHRLFSEGSDPGVGEIPVSERHGEVVPILQTAQRPNEGEVRVHRSGRLGL